MKAESSTSTVPHGKLPDLCGSRTLCLFRNMRSFQNSWRRLENSRSLAKASQLGITVAEFTVARVYICLDRIEISVDDRNQFSCCVRGAQRASLFVTVLLSRRYSNTWNLFDQHRSGNIHHVSPSTSSTLIHIWSIAADPWQYALTFKTDAQFRGRSHIVREYLHNFKQFASFSELYKHHIGVIVVWIGSKLAMELLIEAMVVMVTNAAVVHTSQLAQRPSDAANHIGKSDQCKNHLVDERRAQSNSNISLFGKHIGATNSTKWEGKCRSQNRNDGKCEFGETCHAQPCTKVPTIETWPIVLFRSKGQLRSIHWSHFESFNRSIQMVENILAPNIHRRGKAASD